MEAEEGLEGGWQVRRALAVGMGRACGDGGTARSAPCSAWSLLLGSNSGFIADETGDLGPSLAPRNPRQSRRLPG